MPEGGGMGKATHRLGTGKDLGKEDEERGGALREGANNAKGDGGEQGPPTADHGLRDQQRKNEDWKGGAGCWMWICDGDELTESQGSPAASWVGGCFARAGAGLPAPFGATDRRRRVSGARWRGEASECS